MIVALIILASLAVVGGVLYLHHRLTSSADSPDKEENRDVIITDDSVCCGAHLVCEKTTSRSAAEEQALYYDDEELDAYKGRSADSYDQAEIEQFRDVLLTLTPGEVADWGRSIQLRGIELPLLVRDELLMVLAEARQNPSK